MYLSQITVDLYRGTLSYLPFDDLCSLLFVSKRIHASTLQVYQELLESIRDDWYKNHLFTYAVETRQYKMIRYLVSLNAKYYNRGIITASRCGDLDMVKYLMRRNTIVRSGILRDAVVDSIYEAVTYGHIDVMNYLIYLRKTYPWDVVLRAAAGSNNVTLVNLAIKNGARAFHDALRSAAGNNDREMIYYIMTRIAIYKKGNYLYDCVLLDAAGKNNREIIEYMHNDLEVPLTSDMITHAAGGGHRELVDWLMSKGLKLPIDVLDIAAANGHLDTIEYMIDTYHVNIYELCEPLESAVSNNQRHIVDYLLKNYTFTQASIVDNIMLAAENNHKEMVDYLHGMCKDAMEYYDHNTTIYFILNNEHTAMAEHLNSIMCM